MRVLAIAALSLALSAGAALGQTAAWTDTQGRLTFQHPTGWPVDIPSGQSASLFQVIAGTADEECKFFVAPRDTAARTPDAVRRGVLTPIGDAAWSSTASSLRIFRDALFTVSNARVDTSGFWPVQRATLTSGSDVVQAALQARPGAEYWAFCQTYNGSDRTAVFEQVTASMGSPRDAEWRTAIEAAQAAAAATTPPPQQ
ncbi:MAG: hypothetical protein AB7O04_06910 [Hyphomonadaceae bacterium]